MILKGGMMSNINRVGHIDQIKPSTTDNLVNTDLFKMINPKIHGTHYSFSMMRVLPGGSVAVQSHPEEHAIFMLAGECKILLEDEWVNVPQGSFLHIPPELTHSFSNESKSSADILILKI